MPVRILDEHLINKIAAGEVVERPASVLKELFENSLDSGATDIRVHLRAGGRNLVKVIDNGSGMNRTDAMMCIERHATSKILTDDDLFRVSTLGFRGEAIPSIAAVSRFTLLTRVNPGVGRAEAAENGADIGTCVEMEGGRLLDVREAGCAPGTEIAVANLFFNVPARRKFLRTIETELSHCVEAVTRAALNRPDLDLELTHEDRQILRCTPTTDPRRRASDLLGPHGEALIPVAFTRGNLEVRALLSPVGVHRAQPTGSTWMYVNGRFVRDLTLRRALTAAYSGIVPKDRFPLVILDVRVPPGDVDVNVHPAKTEVRFAHGYELQNAVTQGLRAALQDYGIQRPVTSAPRYTPEPVRASSQIRLPDALGDQTPVPTGRTFDGLAAEPMAVWSTPATESMPGARTADPAPPFSAPFDSAPPVSRPAPPFSAPFDPAPPVSRLAPPFSAARTADPAPPFSADFTPAPPFSAAFESTAFTPSPPAQRAPDAAAPTNAAPTTAAPTPPVPAPRATSPNRPLLPVARFRDLRIIGQLKKTYLLCEGAGELVIIDQHAAAERITLYRLTCDRASVVGGAQQLLTPRLVRLGPSRARALAPEVDTLLAWGLDVRFMGGDTFAVHSLPGPLARADIDVLLGDVADELASGAPASMPQERLDHFLNTLACHTSIRAGDLLSHDDIARLLRDLDDVDFSVCAHGRPVAIWIGPEELERRFHR